MQRKQQLQIERLRRGWSQQQLSAKTGVAQSDLSAIENGRRAPGSGWRRRIAEVFGVPESSLFRDADPTETAAEKP